MATAPPSVEVQGLTKRFGAMTAIASTAAPAAVDGVSLSVARGEMFSLLGPSGCGKTTLLRLIGGFESPTAGSVRIGGVDVTRWPADRRPVHLVFQQYALFPHLSVAANVAFGLRYQGLRRSAEAARVAAALALVRLAGLEDRRPDQLSGGQRQRVALARALVLEPQVLLLDEPLSALDRQLREEMQVELKSLQRRVGITFVLVTHDQEEALALSDRLAVMAGGRIAQVGTPAEVYERPATATVAAFLGASNFFPAAVRALTAEGLTVDLAAGGTITVSTVSTVPTVPTVPAPAGGGFRPGDAVRLLVRPEKLVLSAARPAAGAPAVAVTVVQGVYQGASTTWIVADAPGETFQVLEQSSGISGTAGERAGLRPGDAGWLSWPPGAAVVLA